MKELSVTDEIIPDPLQTVITMYILYCSVFLYIFCLCMLYSFKYSQCKLIYGKCLSFMVYVLLDFTVL